MKVGLERKLIAYSIVATVGIILVHALSVLLRKWFAPEVSPAAYPLVWATLAVVSVLFFVNGRLSSWKSAALGGLAVAGVAVTVLTLMNTGYLMPGLALLPAGSLVAVTGTRIAERLPLWLDGVLRTTPVKCILWALVALVMVAQTARLSSWVTDSTQEHWLTTDHPLFAGHMCMVAYVYAADLNRQGVDNIYDSQLYPGMNPDAQVNTTIKNFAPDDPYQYPPQFLLLPRLAIALTSDFDVIKIFWLLVQTMFFGFIAWSVARYVGGEAGLMAALMIPLLYISFPVLSNFQYGQFHFMSILLGVAAMMWFAQGKYHIGAASLAFALLSKLAPGILLAYLIGRRRWKEVGWTLGYIAAFSLLAVLVLGTEPFVAFFSYQLPNLSSGNAFAFEQVWPELKDVIVAGNQSPFAFIAKLDALGIPGMTSSVAMATHLLYTALVTVLAFVAARIKGTRYTEVLIWLALLNLAAMVSKGAWGDYIPIGTLWLMTFMVKDMTINLPYKLMTGVIVLFMFLSLGALPLPFLTEPKLFIALAGIGMLLTIGFNLWVVYHQSRAVSLVRARSLEATPQDA